MTKLYILTWNSVIHHELYLANDETSTLLPVGQYGRQGIDAINEFAASVNCKVVELRDIPKEAFFKIMMAEGYDWKA